MNWKDRPISKRVLANIMATYNTASTDERKDGREWYSDAHQQAQTLADKYHVSLSAAVGAIAALSPGREWTSNLKDADRLIDAFVNHRPTPMVGSYGMRNINKALDILAGRNPLDVFPVTGPKVRAFYSLILNPVDNSQVVIDRHAKMVALRQVLPDEKSKAVKASHYPWYAKHYVKAAESLGILPSQLQAVTWLHWRNRY